MTVQTTPQLGQNATLVEDDESPLDAMQRIDHLSDDELGFVIRDRLNDRQEFFMYSENKVWLLYNEATENVGAYRTPNLSQYLDLFEESPAAVIPVNCMPFWGDGTFNGDEIFP